jgi:hypothetical protein
MAGTGFLVMAVSNTTGLIEMTDVLNNQEIGLTIIYHLVYVGLLTTQFYSHLFLRSLYFLASSTLVMVVRHNKGNANIGAGLVMSVVYLLICESIFYVQFKAQVKLFLASQLI